MTQQLVLDTQQLKHLAELLLGAAYADGDYDGHEAEAIGGILRAQVREGELPEEVTGHLAAFDIDAFSVDEAAKGMSLDGAEQRRAVLQLISEVTHADDVLDHDESEFIRLVGRALGAAPDEYEDLTFDLVTIQVTSPPPIPE